MRSILGMGRFTPPDAATTAAMVMFGGRRGGARVQVYGCSPGCLLMSLLLSALLTLFVNLFLHFLF